MKLEQQVVSLELAKKLKELGVKQDAFWSWFETTDYDDIPRLNTTDEKLGVLNLPQQSWEEKYSALTVAELIILCGIDLYWIRNNAHTWEVSGYKEGFTKAPTLVEALALFVIQKYETNKSI